MMKRNHSAWPAAAALIAMGGLAALGWHTFGGGRIEAASPASTTVIQRPAQSVVDLQNAFQNVAKGVQPAIVSITSRMTVRPAIGQAQFEGFGDLEELFQGAPGLRGPGRMQMAPRTAIGTGSGFIVRSDGYILTNDHVVGGADSVTVHLDDGREFTGTVKRDPRSDLAVVKIDASSLPTLNLADSTGVNVGQWAIAFGSPFGLDDTMTVGVVSALGREKTIGGGPGDDRRFYSNLIQTDASINPGNSGGPLVDIYGNVVGVNVAIGSPTGSNVGIGFAIPASTAKYVMDQLITSGKVVRGYLGFAPETLSVADRTRYGVKEGALVAMVEEGSPAAKAGLQVEDVVISFNGQAVRDAASLRDMVARTAPGLNSTITVVRGGKQVYLTADIGTPPGEKSASAAPTPADVASKGKLGISVADLTPEIAKQLSLDESAKGVVVAEVAPGSPAMEAGIRPGDVVLRVNGRNVGASSEVPDVVKSLKAGEDASIVVRRGGARVLLKATLR
jgi:serine protease Do